MASWIGLDVYHGENRQSCLADRYGLPTPMMTLHTEPGNSRVEITLSCVNIMSYVKIRLDYPASLGLPFASPN
jgi:hypothetical protein